MTEQEQVFFEKLYNRHYSPLYQFIQRLIQDSDAAYDLVQETFTTAYENLALLMQHPNPDGWLYRTARNHSMNYLRLAFHRNLPEDALITSANTENPEAAVLQHFFPLESLHSLLTEEETAILLDRFEYGYSMEETAERNGITYNACKMRMSRIYRKIRSHPEILLLLLLVLERID